MKNMLYESFGISGATLLGGPIFAKAHIMRDRISFIFGLQNEIVKEGEKPHGHMVIHDDLVVHNRETPSGLSADYVSKDIVIKKDKNILWRITRKVLESLF